jgi:hypothetical protein
MGKRRSAVASGKIERAAAVQRARVDPSPEALELREKLERKRAAHFEDGGDVALDPAAAD